MWNKEYLLKKRSEYKKRLNNTSNPEEILNLTNTIYSIEDIIDFIDGNNQECQSESFKDTCHTESLFLSHFKQLVPYVSNFTNSYTSDSFFSFRKLTHYDTKRQEVLDLTKEFYNTLDNRFAKPFNRVFDKNKQWIRYAGNIKACYTWHIYNTNIILMLIGHYYSIEDYLAMVHEYGHAVDVTCSQEEVETDNRIPFSEVVSNFIEMVYGHYLDEKGFSSKDLLAYDISTFTKNLELSIIVNEKNNIVNMFNEAKIFSRKQATKYLKNEVLMVDYGIEQVLDCPITEQFPYPISYQVAIELYLQDKEVAFNIVYNFMKLKDCSVNDYIKFFKKAGVEIGKNTDQYVKMLKNRNDCMRYDK